MLRLEPRAAGLEAPVLALGLIWQLKYLGKSGIDQADGGDELLTEPDLGIDLVLAQLVEQVPGPVPVDVSQVLLHRHH